MTLVFMFPGQNSRYPEMLEKLTAQYRTARELIAEASDVLGRDLGKHYLASNGEIFARNRDVQVGVFLTNHVYLRLLEAAGIESQWSLGLSLGEYNHLVHIGALEFAEGLRLVEARGQLYEQVRGGSMVSLFPVTVERLGALISELHLDGQVCVGLNNTPKQQVVSGLRSAVEALVAAVEQEDFVHAVEIESNLPMHSPPFEEAAVRLGELLATRHLATPRLPYVSNAAGAVVEQPSADALRRALTAHAWRPVKWQSCIEAVAARCEAPHFIEAGPRAVLCGLFGRGWAPGGHRALDVEVNWPLHFEHVLEELQHARL